jgi:mRNA-degrading endonuclease toxin of MazEF toxin-antitoxin module
MDFKPMRLGLAALVLTVAGAAHAGDTEDFAGCDGLRKPKGSDDGMRGEAVINGYHSDIFGASPSQPRKTIASCDIALASPKLLSGQTLRRAHLLRARAAARLELGHSAQALADLDQARALVADRAGDRFFARSMGASLDLLTALAKAGLGQTDDAARLAGQAAAARPYALQVQLAAWAVRNAAHAAPAAGVGDARHLLALEPRAATQLIMQAYRAGDFAGVRSLAPAGAIASHETNPDGTKRASILVRIDDDYLNDLAATLAVAYADAAAGDAVGARRRLQEARDRIASTTAAMTPTATAATTATATAPASTTVQGDAGERLTKILAEQIVNPRAALVEARLALDEEGPAAALAKVVAAKLPADAAAVDLLRAIRAKAPADVKAPDPAALAAQLTRADAPALGRIAPTLLIAPESARKVIDYQKSRPNVLAALVGGALSMGAGLLGGIPRTSGFRSTANPDGTTTVEYVGNTSSGPMVQEMTLLRAAELAREAGKPRFAIVRRHDYQRFLTTTQYGVEISRQLAGYKTELTIRFLADDTPAALDAVRVIDDLGPLYYES